ncbi:MAG: cell division protein FtsW [Acidobacteria bacterium RIFCSPLOWO2_02_FULL_68_18]|nr:MAG: cell division protein FtsW [Acidobacteria bacterium RIFCSPLOWO2_02_FULL_68_18]OFW48499.1 MAG: cell division protein FtsW [Acidobacteria bacterium RIFCSPLOWO2_12_FULL_68_19]
MARKLKSDRVLFTATLLLVCTSVVMVYSASALLALERYQQPYLFVTRQAMWTILGLAALWVAMRVDYRTYRNDALIWTLVGIVAVTLVGVLFSAPVNGTRRWFGIGGLGVQPSELAKLACVLFTALVLERRMHRIDELSYSLLPIGIVVGAMVALILLQPDFGTAMSLVLIVAAMVFVAGLHYRYLVGTLLVMLPALYLVLVSAPYRRRRLLAFWDPWADPLGDGFQIIQSLVAVGTGGVFGRGLMAGVQKLFYLPEPHTDFIYAVIGEELGLVGATATLLCFCLIAWRGLRITARAQDTFGAFVALGITTMIVMQALINMSVVLGLLPTKGIPLPLVSAGGSSLVISLLGMGVLLNISQHETTAA